MKRLFLVILLLGSIHAVKGAEAVAPDTTKPDTTKPATAQALITAGFDAYTKTNAAAALDIWLKGSPLENEAAIRTNFIAAIAKIEGAYGKFLGWETIKTVELGRSVRFVYVIAKFEKVPLWMVFNCYKPADQWVVAGLDMNTSASKILPATMLDGQ